MGGLLGIRKGSWLKIMSVASSLCLDACTINIFRNKSEIIVVGGPRHHVHNVTSPVHFVDKYWNQITLFHCHISISYFVSYVTIQTKLSKQDLPNKTCQNKHHKNCVCCPGHHLIVIPHICHFFTQAKFLENKIYTEKRQFLPIFRQFLPIYTEICTEKRQFLPIFRVKSVKIYTGQKKFTRAPPVTNIRYGHNCRILLRHPVRPRKKRYFVQQECMSTKFGICHFPNIQSGAGRSKISKSCQFCHSPDSAPLFTFKLDHGWYGQWKALLQTQCIWKQAHNQAGQKSHFFRNTLLCSPFQVNETA